MGRRGSHAALVRQDACAPVCRSVQPTGEAAGGAYNGSRIDEMKEVGRQWGMRSD